MASLESFKESDAAVVYDDDLGEVKITGGAVNIDGALDAIDEKYRIIRISGGGILRFRAGASGTLGGRKQALLIIEEDDAEGLGADNGKYNKTGGGENARFGPRDEDDNSIKNTAVIDNVIWLQQGRAGRSDFDFAQGTNQNGSLGCDMTIRGLHLIQQYTGDYESGGIADDSNQNNHMYSQNLKLQTHPELGFSLRISNYTTRHAFFIEAQPNAQFEGLKIDNISAVGSGGRVVVHPNGATFTIHNLDTPDITESDSSLESKIILVNPNGVPTRSSDWSGTTSTMEVHRDVPFNFTGADNASGTLEALHQNSHDEAADATATIPTNGQIKIRVKTNFSSQATSGAWRSLDGFQFSAYGRGFQKYYSGTTTINVGNTPATRNVTLTNDAFPDGTAITDYTGTDAADTASEIYRIIKKHELANPTHRTLGTSIATIDNNGNIDVDSTVALNVSTTQSQLAVWNAVNSTLTIKVAMGVIADLGINAINFGNRTLPGLQSTYFAMPIKTADGESSLIKATGAADHSMGVYKADGTPLGFYTYAANGYAPDVLVSATNSAAGTKIIYTRPGYICTEQTLDLSDGGVFAVNFGALREELDQNGNPLYDSNATLAGLTASFGDDGRCTLEIPNSTANIKQLYKAFQDGLATRDGGKFCALGRQLLQVSEYPGQPANLTLGPDIQLRRAASSGNNAGVAAVPFGGINGRLVNTDRGEVLFLPSASDILAKLDIAIEQNKLTMQNLPRHFYSPWVPENPAVFFVYGQLRLHDVNKRNWNVENPDGNLVINQDGDGYGTFDGSTLVRTTLNRENAQGTLVNFAEECTAAFRIKPIDEDGTFIIAELGAMRLNLVMSGGTGTLQVGSVGPQTYTHATITAGMQHDIILTFQRNTRDGASSHPIVRLSASNGYADGNTNSPNVQTLQTWNVDTNEVFGAIASHTGYFNFGHSGGSGFKGDMSNVYFHPSSTAINYTWEVGNHAQAAGFNVHKQIWHGLPCDSSEGLSDDLLEETAEDTNGKVNEIPQNTAAAVASRSLAGQTATKDGLLGERIKWLTDNLNADDTATIVDAIYDEGASDHDEADSFGAVFNAIPTTAPDSKEDIADAVLDELLSGHTTSGSLGAAVAAIPTDSKSDIAAEVGARTIPDTPTAGTYDAAMKNAEDANTTTPPTASAIATEVGAPSAASIATAVENELTIPTAAQNADAVWDEATTNHTGDGTFGKRLQDTSTHDAPADSPQASAVAQAVWQREIPETPTSNSYGAKLKALVSPSTPLTAQQIATAVRQEIMSYSIETGVSYEEAFQAVAAVLGGKGDYDADGKWQAKSIGGGDNAEVRLKLKMGSAAGTRTASEIPGADPEGGV